MSTYECDLLSHATCLTFVVRLDMMIERRLLLFPYMKRKIARVNAKNIFHDSVSQISD